MSVRGQGAFSMVEVVIAVSVLAVAVATVLALLPLLTREMADSGDSLVAQRFSGAIEAEMRRLAGSGSLDTLATSIKPSDASSTLTLVAPRDGRDVREESASDVEEWAQYFAIELWQFSTPPLAYERAVGAVLPVQVRVSWPYKLRAQDGGAVRTEIEDRSSITFTVSLRR
ncbi:MAG: hypothetical protein NVV63_13025 [Opitutus sp.]|nr:hypothetical protein [Opitutus sp.]